MKVGLSCHPRLDARMSLVYVGDVGLGCADKIDSVLAAALGFQQRFVRLLKEFLNCAAVAGETCQAAAYGQNALALRAEIAGRG